jgi:HEAT repeat protein
MLDEAFEALKQYNWGTDRAPLAPIDEAVAAAHGSAQVRQGLEDRLLAALQSDISRDAKDYVCRKLRIVGTAASVPALAGLLADKYHAHMARYALERMPAPEAAQALCTALPKLSGNLKIGVISSIGARGDAAGVSALAGLLADNDAAIARAAALALGDIGNVPAARALQAAEPAAGSKQAVIDAQLACAEALLAKNETTTARAIYQSLAANEQAKLVRLAATRGMLACAAKNA